MDGELIFQLKIILSLAAEGSKILKFTLKLLLSQTKLNRISVKQIITQQNQILTCTHNHCKQTFPS